MGARKGQSPSRARKTRISDFLNALPLIRSASEIFLQATLKPPASHPQAMW
jgi:hypothetical protein